MKILVYNLKMNLDDTIYDLKKVTSKKIGVSERDFASFKIVKESIDARKKPHINIVYSVMVETDRKIRIPSKGDIRVLEDVLKKPFVYGSIKIRERPVVIGSGPAGLFASLILAQNGYKPLLLERGECVEKRTQIVNSFWAGGKLDEETMCSLGKVGQELFQTANLPPE